MYLQGAKDCVSFTTIRGGRPSPNNGVNSGNIQCFILHLMHYAPGANNINNNLTFHFDFEQLLPSPASLLLQKILAKI